MTSFPCGECGKLTQRRSVSQRYCSPCSEERDRRRKREWARAHPQTHDPVATKLRGEARTATLRAAGAERSVPASVGWYSDSEPTLGWLVRISVPFSYAMSKNAVWRSVGAGHLTLREEANAVREELREKLAGIRSSMPIVQDRIWLDLMVEKPNHKGDAINVIDFVADAAKDALGVDDRWFSIRRLDWRIVKTDPRLIIGIGQDVGAVPSQACSYCGRILPLTMFGTNRSAPAGRARTCQECTRASSRVRRAEKRALP